MLSPAYSRLFFSLYLSLAQNDDTVFTMSNIEIVYNKRRTGQHWLRAIRLAIVNWTWFDIVSNGCSKSNAPQIESTNAMMWKLLKPIVESSVCEWICLFPIWIVYSGTDSKFQMTILKIIELQVRSRLMHAKKYRKNCPINLTQSIYLLFGRLCQWNRMHYNVIGLVLSAHCLAQRFDHEPSI